MVAIVRVGEHLGLRRRHEAARAAPVLPPERLPSAQGEDGQPAERYAVVIFQVLAFLRFVSFALGAALTFIIHPLADPFDSRLMVTVVVGVYNAVRVLWPHGPVESRAVVRALGVVTDVAAGLTLVLMTGGLESSFLIFSLAPVITVAVLMELRMAVTVAAASALAIMGAYIAGGLGLSGYPWILEGNYLVFSLLYSAVCLLVAVLPFVANLSWQRRVRADSMEAERRRLRREVHDNIAQTLAFLSLKMRRAEERAAGAGVLMPARDVADIARVVERAYLAVRDYLDGAVDASVLRGSFDELLERTVDQWSREAGIRAETVLTGRAAPLAPEVQLQLLQITREALANVGKHANPRRVWVSREATPAATVLRIKDDGRGFAGEASRGHGMSIMQERATMVGATLTVTSAPGQGTEVVVAYLHEDAEGGHEKD